jgi:hypothetical protein
MAAGLPIKGAISAVYSWDVRDHVGKRLFSRAPPRVLEHSYEGGHV